MIYLMVDISLSSIVRNWFVFLANRFERMRAGVGCQAGPVAPVVIVLEPEGHAVLLDFRKLNISLDSKYKYLIS